jgi:hypothetical protein
MLSRQPETVPRREPVARTCVCPRCNLFWTDVEGEGDADMGKNDDEHANSIMTRIVVSGAVTFPM